MRGRGAKGEGAGSVRGGSRVRRDGETEAALALLGCRAPAIDAHPRRPSFVKYLAQRGEASAKKGGEWRRVHDVLFYEVQSAGQRDELYAIEL